MCEEEKYLIQVREEEIRKMQEDLKKKIQKESKRKSEGNDIRKYFGEKRQKTKHDSPDKLPQLDSSQDILNAEVGTGGGSAQYCGNIGIVNDECGTEMAGYEGDQLVTWKHEGKGDSMWRKSSRSEECLSPSLKQNLKLKSFGSGKKSGTGLSGMGTVVTGKYAQLRGGKLSKFKSSVLKEKIDLFEIFQGKNIVKAKKTEGLVTPIESKFNISVAGNDQDIPASRLRTNGSGAGEPWSLDLRPCGLGQEVRASQNLPEQN